MFLLMVVSDYFTNLQRYDIFRKGQNKTAVKSLQGRFCVTTYLPFT